MKLKLKFLPLIIIPFVLSGCAAIGTLAKHHSLETQTLMSKSIFLDPSQLQDGTAIYLSVTNTTDNDELYLKGKVRSKLEEKGYTIVKNPKEATFILEINVLQVGKKSKTSAEEMMESGYGGAIEGGVAGVGIAAAAGVSSVAGGVGAAIGGAVIGEVTDNLVKDVNYVALTDVHLIQYFKTGKTKIFKTRILSTADRVNLSLESAIPTLERGLSLSISGIFPSIN